MTYIVPSEILPDVVLNLDDFSQEPGNNCMDTLLELKKKYPKFKVTLFAIPFHKQRNNQEFLRKIVNSYDWIRLGIHGWTHDKNECLRWSAVDIKFRLYLADQMRCFDKVFKAPNWRISNKAARVLNDHGFVIAELNSNKGKLSYKTSHPWCVHGHTWDLNNPDPKYNNGIRQIIKRGVPWNERTNFHFISDLYDI